MIIATKTNREHQTKNCCHVCFSAAWTYQICPRRAPLPKSENYNYYVFDVLQSFEDCIISGLPRLLVDIRHEASHNELPSLPLLRLGTAQSLQWLTESYWDRQTKHLQSCYHRLITLLKASVILLRVYVIYTLPH